MISINGKPLICVYTKAFTETFNADLIKDLTVQVTSLIINHPVDMLSLEQDGSIKSSGYFLFDDPDNLRLTDHMDEYTILTDPDPEHTLTHKVYFKIDDYGDSYIGTFMLSGDS
jgi:hypothetical protein